MNGGNPGGVPRVFRFTAANGQAVPASADGLAWNVPFEIKYLQVRNEGANPVRLYFHEADFALNGTDFFVELAAGGSAGDYFEGPVRLPSNENLILLRATGGATDVVAIAYAQI